jgi:hypothetical protein
MASARIFAVIAVSTMMFGFCAVSSVAAQVKTMASRIAIDFIVGAPFST